MHGFQPHEFGITFLNIDQMIENGFEASFAPPELKAKLIAEAKLHNSDVWATDFGGVSSQGGHFPEAVADPPT